MPKSKSTTPPKAKGGSGPATSGTASCPPKPCPPPPAWLAKALKIMCPKDKAFLDDLRARGVTLTAYDRIYYDDPYYDGTKWTTKRFEAGGSTSGTHIDIVTGGMSDTAVAETLYHEGVHTGQPSSMSWNAAEYDAYTKGEQWRIDHGLPESRPGFRTKDANGKPVPDTKAIKAFVDKEYPIAVDKPAKPSGATYKVIGRDAKGDTIIQNTANPADTKTRAPKKGDTYAGPQVEQPPGGRPAKSCQLKCP
jgi:hypothetical protein